ncbi:follitropin subunit beta [Clupea harengus]|uniref:Follitropin subunit beta n=1 Tax=Clupea harengus TaxID=7950 RepID=A0A6P8EST8_CLUHA|nr:follitropin subunit beta [Clupea harengus]
MHVVVMAVLWSLVQAVVPDCWTGCQLANISVPVETDDGRSCFIETQACAGLCHNKDPVYKSSTGVRLPDEQQRSCHFQDSYTETRSFPVHCYTGSSFDLLLTVTKALSCECSSCTNKYECDSLSPNMAGCPSPKPPLLQYHL